MRTKKQKQATTRNFQLLITGGIIANLNRMDTKTTKNSASSNIVRAKIIRAKEAINELQIAIFKTTIEDWNE